MSSNFHDRKGGGTLIVDNVLFLSRSSPPTPTASPALAEVWFVFITLSSEIFTIYVYILCGIEALGPEDDGTSPNVERKHEIRGVRSLEIGRARVS